MRRMIYGAVAVGVILVPILAGQMKKPHTPAATIARGKYLVESIGMCGDCHTPHDQKGEPIKAQWLHGTQLAFQPSVPMPVWADKSPNIAGLPGWDKDAAIKFFMTGLAANGLPARPPMPQYRYTQQDAAAIVAYLKSLAPAKSN